MSDAEILFEVKDGLGLITLNRPKALNALTHGMILELEKVIPGWEKDPAVKAVILRGAGDRAFCAGGDVVGVVRAGQRGSDDWEEFFGHEYRLNHAIATYMKPYVALIDGIVMGGGVGLSIHAPYRVVTEKVLFAMPETGIGLIPDVGGTYALPRLPGQIGTAAPSTRVTAIPTTMNAVRMPSTATSISAAPASQRRVNSASTASAPSGTRRTRSQAAGTPVAQSPNAPRRSSAPQPPGSDVGDPAASSARPAASAATCGPFHGNPGSASSPHGLCACS